jgi:hypothetical protein
MGSYGCFGASPWKRSQSIFDGRGELSSGRPTFQCHCALTSVIWPSIPSSSIFFAFWILSMERRCMPICTICLVRRTALTISTLCSSE